MQKPANSTARLKVSPAVARLVGKEVPRSQRLAAARGEVPLPAKELLTVLFFLVHGGDAEIRGVALQSLRALPTSDMVPALREPALHPRLLDLVARLRLAERAVMEPLLANPNVGETTLVWVGEHAAGEVLSLLAQDEGRLRRAPQLRQAILDNPRAERSVKIGLGWRDPAACEETPPPDGEEDAEAPAEEEGTLSKFQMAMDMPVVEKIKMAMSGDKEWRGIFLKDANKLVASAVLKNPRITEGEILTVAKNRSASDELIRIITLNREWLKNYEIKRALVYHPRTPLPKALRYMGTLGEKDIKAMAKSRNIAQVLVNNARRMLFNLEKKK